MLPAVPALRWRRFRAGSTRVRRQGSNLRQMNAGAFIAIEIDLGDEVPDTVRPPSEAAG